MLRDDLIAAARAGDPEALSALLKACQPDLRLHAQRKCASKDVDDAVQDALWIVHQRYKALRHPAALSGWLFKVIQRICLRMGYRERKLTSLDESFLQNCSSVHVGDLRLDMEKALVQLEPQQIEVLLLRDMNGYSAEEVATQLQISSEAVKGRLHRARTNVRKALGKEERSCSSSAIDRS